MTLQLAAEPVPLYWAEEGRVLRVEGTRLSLDRLVYLFEEEFLSADEIAARYRHVGRANIYAVLTYYLRHKEEVDQYIAQGREEADKVQREVEALMATRKAEKQGRMRATTGESPVS